MTKTILRRQGNMIIPVGAESIEVLHGFKDGSEFIGDLHGARNLRHLKLFWVLCSLVTDTTGRPKEVVKRDIAMATGFVDYYTDRLGGVHMIPMSIAIEKMKQDVFRDFFNNAINVIAGWLETSPDAVRARFEDMIADKRYNDMIR